MEEASADLADTASEEDSPNTPLADPFSNDKAGADYNKDNLEAKSEDDEVSMSAYDSDVLEVSLGEFKAAHGQKYQDLANFLRALWNKARPAVGSMKIMLELMRTEFEGG
jgi:hypothetical protein